MADDPTADFLAREQAAMQEIGESIENLGIENNAAVLVPSSNTANDFGFFDGEESSNSNNNNNNNNFVPVNESAGNNEVQVEASANVNSSFATSPTKGVVIESEAIREWRIKFEEVVRVRDEASATKKQAILAKAQKDLQDFYSEYEAKKSKRHDKNVADQEEAIRQRDEDPVGKRWEIINKMTETVPKGKGAKDCSRMKGMIHQLKGDSKAPGNAV